MKKVILSLAMFAFLTVGNGWAQDRPQRMNPEQRMEQMVKELNLTEAQAKEFKAVMESMRPQRGQGERPSREEMEKRRKEMDAKMKTILTEEQYKKFEEMQKRRGPRGGGNR